MKKRLLVSIIMLAALAGCNFQPAMKRVTATGKPCHAIGYSWSPVWVGPDNSTVCM